MKSTAIYSMLGILCLGVLSFIVAVSFPDLLSGAIREMATGAFGGVVVGAVILLYEQLRETHREEVQFERDRRLAKQIRDDANREKDLRSLADYLLIDLHRAWSQLQMELRTQSHTQFDWLLKSFRKVMLTGRMFTTRVGDSSSSDLWSQFATSFEVYSKSVEAPLSNRGNEYMRECLAAREKVETAIEAIIERAESLPLQDK